MFGVKIERREIERETKARESDPLLPSSSKETNVAAQNKRDRTRYSIGMGEGESMGDLDDLYWRMSERERYTNKEAKERAYLATAWLRQYATDSRYLARSSGTPLPPCSTPDERRSRGGQALGSSSGRARVDGSIEVARIRYRGRCAGW